MEKDYLDFLEFYAACYVDRIYKIHPNDLSAFNAETPFIRQILNAHKMECLEHFIQMWIKYVVERIKVKTNPDESDQNLVINAICQEYQHFRISEVAFIFIEMATGKYGVFYQALTPVYILQCFRDYEVIRKKYLPRSAPENSYPVKYRTAFIVNGLLENGRLKGHDR